MKFLVIRGQMFLKDVKYDDIIDMDIPGFKDKHGNGTIVVKLSREPIVEGETPEYEKSVGHDIVRALVSRGFPVNENFVRDENRNLVLDENGQPISTGYSLKIRIYPSNNPTIQIRNENETEFATIEQSDYAKANERRIETATIGIRIWNNTEFHKNVCVLTGYMAVLMDKNTNVRENYMAEAFGAD